MTASVLLETLQKKKIILKQNMLNYLYGHDGSAVLSSVFLCCLHHCENENVFVFQCVVMFENLIWCWKKHM